MRPQRVLKWFLLIFFTCFPLHAAEGNKISIITLDDKIINPVSAEYILEAIDRAEREGDQALVIELDTPGGLLNTTRQVVKEILNAEVPIIVYISPPGSRAGSAGVFITLAAHLAAMAPSTNIGAAHPVEFGETPRKQEGEGLREIIESLKKRKEDGKEKKVQRKEPVEAPKNPMADKILNDTVAWVSTIAKARGRNVDWAARAVKESISDGEGEALRQGVVDLIAKDLDELLLKVDGRPITLASGKKQTLQTAGVGRVRLTMNFRQRLLDVLINPNIAYILMILGFYGLLFEITHPGVWFPGVAGLICLILAFYAFHTLPTNYAGLALIFLALALFVAEVFVTSYGLLAMVGIVSMLLGSLFLVDSTAEFMQISLKLVIPVVASTALLFFFLVTLAIRAQRQRSPVGMEALVGQVAEVDRSGRVFVGGEWWDTVSDEKIQGGDRVRIEGSSGMRLKVRQI